MSERISSSRRAMLETVASVGQKTTSWALVVAGGGYMFGGKYADLWQAMLPLSIIAGLLGFWAAGKLPDRE